MQLMIRLPHRHRHRMKQEELRRQWKEGRKTVGTVRIGISAIPSHITCTVPTVKPIPWVTPSPRTPPSSLLTIPIPPIRVEYPRGREQTSPIPLGTSPGRWYGGMGRLRSRGCLPRAGGEPGGDGPHGDGEHVGDMASGLSLTGIVYALCPGNRHSRMEKPLSGISWCRSLRGSQVIGCPGASFASLRWDSQGQLFTTVSF